MASTRGTSADVTSSSPLILFLGSSVSGKSSSINVLTGKTTLSPEHTQDFSLHNLVLENKEPVTLVDTPALNNTSASIALFNKFISQVKSHSVAACVFVQPKGRIDAAQDDSYHIAQHAANKLGVPLIMAISSTDDDANMLDWWNENSSTAFTKYRWKFDAIAPLCGMSDKDIANKTQRIREAYVQQRAQGRQFLTDALQSTALLGTKAKPIPIEENIFLPLSKPTMVSHSVFKPSPSTEESKPVKSKGSCLIM